MVLARYIAPAEYGLVSIATMILFMATIISQGGISQALIQLKTTVIMNLSSGLISGYFNEPELNRIVKYISFTFLINGFGIVSRGLLEKHYEFKKLMITNILSYFAGWIIVGIPLAINGYGPMSLVYSILVQSAFQSILWYSVAKHPIKVIFRIRDFNKIRKVLIFGGGQILLSFFNMLALQIDKFIVGKFMGAAQLGYYGRAFSIMDLPVKHIGGTIDRVMFPTFSEMNDEPTEIISGFYKITSLMTTIIIPLSVVIFISAESIVLLLLGEKWTSIVFPLQILLISIPFRTLTRISDSLIRSRGLVYRGSLRKFIYSFILACSVFIGKEYGLEGVSVGVNIAVLFDYFLTLLLLKTNLHLKMYPYIKAIIPSLRISLIIALITYSINKIYVYGYINYIPNIMLIILMTVLVFAVIQLKYPRILGHEWNWFIFRMLDNKNLKYLKKYVKEIIE